MDVSLQDSAFITEVHHVNEEGEDAGVVYCEMQARENSGESRCHLALLRALYPGHCGCKSETGGLMANLRDSCNNVKVREKSVMTCVTIFGVHASIILIVVASTE